MKIMNRKDSAVRILCLISIIGMFMAFACARPGRNPSGGDKAALEASVSVQQVNSPLYVDASEMIKLANHYDISLTGPEALPMGDTAGERLMWRDWIYSEIEKKNPHFKRP